MSLFGCCLLVFPSSYVVIFSSTEIHSSYLFAAQWVPSAYKHTCNVQSPSISLTLLYIVLYFCPIRSALVSGFCVVFVISFSYVSHFIFVDEGGLATRTLASLHFNNNNNHFTMDVCLLQFTGFRALAFVCVCLRYNAIFTYIYSQLNTLKMVEHGHMLILITANRYKYLVVCF